MSTTELKAMITKVSEMARHARALNQPESLTLNNAWANLRESLRIIELGPRSKKATT